MMEALRGDGSCCSVDKTVELFTGAEGELDVALGAALLHSAFSVFEGDGGTGTALDFKTDGNGFLVCQQTACLGSELTEVFERTENCVKVDIRKGS